ncbi:dihydrolipoamide dehydrogenase [Halarchaeum rubridurum]|uniref:Dihydrolipoamide dehydrogenase n=1 Tax=Halarchaeum rubridurum TaxID=489911 RepID=A0A830G0D9_9EURY|nr:NAD(P)/FAD-dependent oxidoreductase [Halarchaeum rubridurum]MBP1955076.1 dihydrolipoamide dehydrogenase [Halarchaeum rubridurum]GGM69171.1 pyridine nucleotide-disulfide oxidoreductase [Halarchaeum rubridurum]
MHVLVIGAYGSAGVAAAEVLADADVEVTLVDDGEPGGGLCILRGCMPSKEVLSAAHHGHQARSDPRLDADVNVDLERVVARKDDHTASFARHRRDAVHDLAERENVTFHHETARFVDDGVVAVGDERYEPDYVVVATGSTPRTPDLPGIDDVDVMDSADVLDATSLPDSGVVLGFGAVGLELVPYLAEAGGTDLTVIEHDARPLDRAAPKVGDGIVECYREEFGVDVLTNADERRVEPTADGGVRLTVERADGVETVEADRLFCFTGRVPTVEGLGFEATRVEPDAGWVDPGTLRARDDPTVFAAGDVVGARELLHTAKEEGAVAARNVLADWRDEALETYDPTTHRVVFAAAGVYPYVTVGMTPGEAENAGHDVLTASRKASDDGVFRTKNAARGRAELVVDANDGTVLGYHGWHYEADVMAKTLQVLVEAGMDVRDVPDRAFHPTTPEIIDGLVRKVSEELR